MKLIRITYFIIVMLCLSLGSCSKSSNDDGCSDSELNEKDAALGVAYAAVIDANFTYIDDRTTENCILWRDAYIEYLDKYKVFIDCLDEMALGSWQASYNLALQARADIPC